MLRMIYDDDDDEARQGSGAKVKKTTKDLMWSLVVSGACLV